jgi:hypothetical protein
MEAESSDTAAATDLVTARMLFSGLQVKPPSQQSGPRHTIDAILGLSAQPSGATEPGGAESSGE